jgi:cytochrome c oxidase subunit III
MSESEHEHSHGGGDDHGGHHGNPWIQHHYDDAKHQFDAGKLGIWFFLVQEVLFFSGLFVMYILYRAHHGEIYEYAHHYLAVKWGAINTGVLISSSLSAAWAVRCAQLNQRRGLILCIVITIACAFGFLGIKYIEYAKKIRLGELFGARFDPCFTPNETPLLTKTKKCPGHVSSVIWDPTGGPDGTGAAKSGCLEAGNYDRDPKTPGIQAQCSVNEATLEKGKLVAISGKPELEACELEKEAATGEWVPKKTPCYVVQLNHNVCPAGPGVIIRYGDEKIRDNVYADIQCNKAPAPAAAADPFAEKKEEIRPGVRVVNPAHMKTDAEEVEELESQPPPPHTNMFFSIYFAMTGLHGLHVLFGIFVFIWLLYRAVRGHFSADYFGPVDYSALYWHLVDLIWIFLFPLLYLIH